MAVPEPPSELVHWLFDTRTWYPEVTTTESLETHASWALALLSPDERAGVLRYFRVADAKMSLASHLLKHFCIARLASVPWSLTSITRAGDPNHGKPIWVPPPSLSSLSSSSPSSSSSSSSPPPPPPPPVSFNVTHQAGIVALIAVAAYPPPGSAPIGGGGGASVEVGVDVVCTSERRARDRDVILGEDEDGGVDQQQRQQRHLGHHQRVPSRAPSPRPRSIGWESFIDMHSDVFAPGEAVRLKRWRVDPGQTLAGSLLDVTDAKLRAFYALWALREAFIKLTGEALLAPWLRELEFHDFAPPRPTAAWDVPAREGAAFGEVVQVGEVFLRGRRVEDVNISLRSIGPDYMVATAARTRGREADALGWRLGPYEELKLDDVLDYAEVHP